MGTRGAVGVRVGGVDKIAYNHFDSHPGELGEAVLAECRELAADMPGLLDAATQLRVVSEDVPPTQQEAARLSQWSDMSVGGHDGGLSWYRVLRRAQGGIASYLQAGVICDAADFLADSLFCEWAYIVNLDEDVLEVYRGFQREPGSGRYAQLQRKAGGEHYGVSLIGSIPLIGLPSDLSQLGVYEPNEES